MAVFGFGEARGKIGDGGRCIGLDGDADERWSGKKTVTAKVFDLSVCR